MNRLYFVYFFNRIIIDHLPVPLYWIKYNIGTTNVI